MKKGNGPWPNQSRLRIRAVLPPHLDLDLDVDLDLDTGMSGGDARLQGGAV